MRTAMAAYIRSVVGAYDEAAALLPPGDRARLPLLTAGPFTVAAVGTRYLHLLATTDPLPAPRGPEVEIPDAAHGLAWAVRFFDPVVAPALGLVDESAAPQPGEVRAILGIRTTVFHLTVSPGSGLSPHHAQHAGTGLAHAHARAGRDFATALGLAPHKASLVEEMHAAAVAGLPYAHALLAEAICPGLTATDPLDLDAVRHAMVEGLRQ